MNQRTGGRVVWALLLGLGMGSLLSAGAPPEWKDYENSFLGAHLKVHAAWTEIFLKESKTTGSVTFNVARDPQASLTLMRMKAEYPFEVWVSSEILTQIFQPGYQGPEKVQLAGREWMKVVGTSKHRAGRKEETYFSGNDPLIDQITFAAPEDRWSDFEPLFATLRQNILWKR